MPVYDATKSHLETNYTTENSSQVATTDAYVFDGLTIFDKSDGFVLLCFGTVGCVLNIATSVAMVAVPRKLKPFHQLCLRLSITDIILCIIYIDNTLHLIVPICKSGISPNIFVENVLLIDCLWCLLLIGLDHYFAICNPLHYPSIVTSRKVLISIGITVGLSLLLLTPFIMVVSSGNVCTRQMTEYIFDQIYTMMIVGALVTVALIFLYLRVYFEALNATRKITMITVSSIVYASSQSSSQHSSSKKAVKTIGLILGGFLVFWIPGLIIALVLVIERSILINLGETLAYLKVAKWWQLLNAIYDPLIYGIRLPEVKEGFQYIKTKLKKLLKLRE